MAFNTINDTEIEVGKPTKKSLFQKIKDNFDDHEGRLNAVQVSSGIIDIFNSNLQDLNVGVGNIVSSEMTESQFQEANGTSWVLCDGQNVSGSTWSVITGNNNTPDLRDEFIRGASTTNPLGQEQTESVGSTSPSPLGPLMGLQFGTTFNMNINNQITGVLTNSAINGANAPTYTFPSDENRPRNIALNFFMKINPNSLSNKLIYKATNSFDITNVQSTILLNSGGSPNVGETYEIDIKTGSDISNLVSIFATRPSVTINNANPHETGAFTITTGGEVVNAGDYVVFDIISLPSWNSRLHVYVTGSPT